MYENKERTTNDVKAAIYNARRELHPTDAAEMLREVETYTGEQAKKQETHNEKHGVPEHPDAPEMKQ